MRKIKKNNLMRKNLKIIQYMKMLRTSSISLSETLMAMKLICVNFAKVRNASL